MKKILTTAVVLSLTFFTATSQVEESNIENLAFQGVGTRGVALVGAIHALEENGKFSNIKRVSGVSSGSIVALLYALGYTSEEMKEIFFEIDFGSLEDKPCIFRVKKKFGYYKGKKLEKLLKKYIANSKFNLDENATFSDLNAKKTTELYIFAGDINAYSITELSYRKTPDVMLWEAVRASISIPLVFPAWKFTQGMPNQHLYVDGGILLDLPINFFDNPPFNTTDDALNKQTLGFMIDNKAIDDVEINLDYGSPFKEYLNAIYQTVVDGQVSVIELNPEEAKRIVVIEIDGDNGFSLNNAQKLDLYNRGFKYTNLFLKR